MDSENGGTFIKWNFICPLKREENMGSTGKRMELENNTLNEVTQPQKG